MTEREANMLSYIKLLGDQLNEVAVIAHVHGWRCSPEAFEEGLRLRKLLGLENENERSEVPKEKL